MTEIYGDITKLASGVIVHQTNCQNKIGSGVAGQIIRRWPIVEQAYHAIFHRKQINEIYGSWDPVEVAPGLTVVNLFTQMFYGNSAKTGRVYTDMDKLAAGLCNICKHYPNRRIYIPYHIGCGLAGGDWNELLKTLQTLPVIVVRKN